MKIHLIAIGGSIMHNLAIDLQKAGHIVSGSDDEIYEPARTRLVENQLYPDPVGWDPERIHKGLDLVILGMHARADNSELLRAQELEIPVVSFPEFVTSFSEYKKRVVICGSHGKTTTTSMVMHILKEAAYDFDYLVGAQLRGFDTMVSLKGYPLIIIEGDEYLSSCIDKVPKIWHYRPHISVITGIAWDHMNVFPTLHDYHQAFAGFLERLPSKSKVFYFEGDSTLHELVARFPDLDTMPYNTMSYEVTGSGCRIYLNNKSVDLKIFGAHNMTNLQAAYLIVKELGVPDDTFLEAVKSFEGAAKRLQTLYSSPNQIIFQDFAHAPSKVKATTAAVKEQYPQRCLTACVELHTFSSLNRLFLPQYRGSLDQADQAAVFYSPHTLMMKGMPALNEDEVKEAFGRTDLVVFTNKESLENYLKMQNWQDHNLLLMSSGTFGGMHLPTLVQSITRKEGITK